MRVRWTWDVLRLWALKRCRRAHHLRLADGARVAVEEEAARAGRLAEAAVDQRADHLVGHQPPLRHYLLHALPEVCALRDLLAQHVAYSHRSLHVQSCTICSI